MHVIITEHPKQILTFSKALRSGSFLVSTSLLLGLNINPVTSCHPSSSYRNILLEELMLFTLLTLLLALMDFPILALFVCLAYVTSSTEL